MDLSTITVQDFKDLFFRDFPYLPQWELGESYAQGDVVFNDGAFYQSDTSGNTSEPPGTNWTLVSEKQTDYILDADITKAFGEAEQALNQALYGSNENIQRAYLYLTAHYLVMDIRASQSPFEAASGYLTSRSVGSVSESYQIPQDWTQSAILQPFTTTNYGIKFLSFTVPALVGNTHAVSGTTQP